MIAAACAPTIEAQVTRLFLPIVKGLMARSVAPSTIF